MIVESFDLASYIGGVASFGVCILIFVFVAIVKGSNRQ